MQDGPELITLGLIAEVADGGLDGGSELVEARASRSGG
jgi:hypothetical protein